MSENTSTNRNNSANSASIGLNTNYFSTSLIPCSLRLALIVFYFGAWVSAASAPANAYFYLFSSFDSARAGFLFFTIVGWLASLLLFTVYIFNIVNISFFARIPWNLIIAIFDIVWLIPIFILSIVCAAREYDARNGYQYAVNIGAFASAAFFGFLVTITLGLEAAYHTLRHLREGMQQYDEI